MALNAKENEDITSLSRMIKLFGSGYPLNVDIARQVEALGEGK